METELLSSKMTHLFNQQENGMSTIYSIVYQPAGQDTTMRGDDYQRVPLQQANLVPNHGIEGDQKAGHHPERELNLLSLEWLEEVGPRGFRTAPGQFGEQVILSGVDFTLLGTGARLQLGDTACIEITKPRTGCSRLEAAQGKSIDGIGAIGLLARVVTGGQIAVGDPVTVLETV